MTAEQNVSPSQFYHGTPADLPDGGYIHTPYARALMHGQRPADLQKNPVTGDLDPENARAHNTYMIDSKHEADFWGGRAFTGPKAVAPEHHVYQVEPAAGVHYEPDMHSSSEDATGYEVHGPLRVIRKLGKDELARPAPPKRQENSRESRDLGLGPAGW